MASKVPVGFISEVEQPKQVCGSVSVSIPSAEFPSKSFDRHHCANSTVLHAIFVLSATSAAIISWPSLNTLMNAKHADQYGYTLLVLPTAVALIAVNLKSTSFIIEFAGTAKTIVALAVMLIGLVAWHMLFAQACNLPLNISALVCCWLGLVIVCYGATVLTQLMFPLLFLFLMVPISATTLGGIISLLQSASLEASLLLFRVTGVPVLANGFVLSLPGIDIEIAEECSGIRSSTVLLLTGLVLQYRGLRASWTRMLFVLSVVPLAIAKNAIRIFTLAALATYVSPNFLEGNLHHEGGVIFFLVALVILLVWLRILQRVERALSYWYREREHAHAK